MSTFTSQPGTRLGGRYRLEDQLAAAGGWSAWKAIDEILARPVSVITFAAGFPRLAQVVTAARAASRLTDTRLTQVFDVEDHWEHAYVVLEWPVGDTLTDMLSAGPIEPLTGARIVAEVAAALAAAHAAGLAHLCLRPDSVRWTPAGVKVAGLGIDAAVSGISTDDPALADTQGLGGLLYATLTGRWPGRDDSGLPVAPLADGQPRRPRQVRAGVPAALDEIAGQALALPGRSGQDPFTSPAQVASALAAVIPPVQVPPAQAAGRPAGEPAGLPADPGGLYRDIAADRRSDDGPHGPLPRGRSGPGYAERPGRRGRAGKLAALTLAIAALVAGATAAVHLLNQPQRGAAGATGLAGGSAPPSASPAPTVSAIQVVSAHGFDALTLSDTGDENTAQAANILDGNPAGWSTQDYFGPYFGHLKRGTGLILDLGKPVRVTSVQVKFGDIPGTDVQIKLGNSDARSAQNLASMTTVAQANDVVNTKTFTVTSKVTGRYLVIWFTKLPPAPKPLPNHAAYAAQVYSVLVRGIG